MKELTRFLILWALFMAAWTFGAWVGKNKWK